MTARLVQVILKLTLLLAVTIGALSMPVPHRARPAAAGPSLQGGLPLAFEEPVTGTLDDETFRQVYVFEGQADDVIAISLTRTEGDLDPFLMLTDGQGVILALSDDDGPGMDAEITAKRISADGRYFVIATRFGQEHGSTAGEYSLLLERVAEGIAETTTLQYGDSVLGRIVEEKPLTFYFLRAYRGDVINLTMRRTSGSLDPQLDLATVEGHILASNDDDPFENGTLDAGIANYTVLETDVYLIVATRFGREGGDTEGSYVLTVTQTPPEELGATPDEARLIDYGKMLEGTIDDDRSVRYYRFDARRGDVITVTLSTQSGNLDPMVKLLDANLVVFAQDNDSGDGRDARIAAYTLPATGTYYVVATRNREQEGQTFGGYTLQLSGRPGVAGGLALEIVYGATVSGRIENQHSSEEYVFFGREGDVIRISMERASGDLDALVTLLDSDRKQIAFDDDGGDDQNARIQGFVLPRDDMYILVASRFERATGRTAGAYLLTLELVRSGATN